jgi:hypothetical protein
MPGINYDYTYRDTPFNNHDRTSWLRDNFRRPAYDAPLSQKGPAHFGTKLDSPKKDVDVLRTSASQLFPRHEFSTGRTVFGTIAPSRLPSLENSATSLPWQDIARGIPDFPTRSPMAVPPPDPVPFTNDPAACIQRLVNGLHRKL